MVEIKDDKSLEVGGTVIEALPDAMFRIELSDKSVIIAYLSGKMRFNRIRVLIGDRVLVKLDPYGGKGRIVKRL
jgi:translation initiation factor IF-1